MDYRRDLYKCSKLVTPAEQRARRSERLNNARADTRLKLLENWRGPIEDQDENRVEISTKVLPPPSPIKKNKTRAEMLQEWKLQKLKRIEEVKKKQKPIFKVGVIHRKATGSPLANILNTLNNKNAVSIKTGNTKETKQAGVVTRAKSKLLAPLKTPPKAPKSQFLKAVRNKMKPVNSHKFVVPKNVYVLPYSQKITIPSSPQITKSVRKTKKVEEPELKVKTPGPSFKKPASAKKLASVKKPEVIRKNQEEKIKETEVSSTSDKNLSIEELEVQMKNISMPAENEISSSTESGDYVPIHYSPYVNKVRGSVKKSPRHSKIRLTMDVDEQIQKEENEFKCRIFSFRKFVECQTKRLLDKCDEWRQIESSDPKIPEDARGEIDCVIGKTKLLTSDKFKQFKDIIEKCDQGDPMIKVDDLQGFQDWVMIEVDNIDDAFSKLELRKEKNWVVEKAKPKVAKIVLNKENKVPSKQPAGKSNIRAHILAARKQLIRQNATDLSPLKSLPTWSEAQSPLKKTPSKNDSLIKSVLTSETKKKNSKIFESPRTPKPFHRQSSGLEIFTATQIAKRLTPGKSHEVKPNSTEMSSFITSSTPGKGILKKTPSQSASKRSVAFRLSGNAKLSFETPEGNTNRISARYFLPPEDDDSICNSSIDMADCSPTPTRSTKTKRKTSNASTPVRKSARLANK